ncbi:MAG: DUF3307 domain-containing protein [Armatimonadota bacterium]|nr:DUF3307 domain-containing protein [Armatimonadota bacterium]MDR7403170.1 DUF3307 domain-containing protein [Armatimonadota bacterium]
MILTRLSLLADFVFQPPRLVSWKSRASAGLLVHGVIHLALTAAVGVGYWSARYLVLAATLAIAHLAVDAAKIRMDRGHSEGYWPVATFLGDRALHLAAMVLCAAAFGYDGIGWAWPALAASLAPASVVVAIVYVATLFGGAVLVRLVTDVFRPPASDGRRLPAGAGAFVGVVERLMVTTLVALNQYGAAGFVLAAKFIARYRRIEEEKEFGDYFLVGTLTSMALAILAGLAVRRALGW